MANISLLEDVVTVALSSSDDELIAAAKGLNASIQGHLRRGAEDFWRMGQALHQLFQRRHLKTRWADILGQIGINRTADNHARRLFSNTTLDGLAEFKNRTAALRGLGILVAPSPKDKAPDLSKKPARDARAAVQTSSKDDVASADGRDSSKNDQGNEARPCDADATEVAPKKQVPPVAVKNEDDSLTVMSQVAARLEALLTDCAVITDDHLAQIDRVLAVAAQLKEVARVAA